MERIDSAMAKFAIEMEVVWCPDDSDGTVLKHLGLPDAFEPRVLRRAQGRGPFFKGQRFGGAILVY